MDKKNTGSYYTPKTLSDFLVSHIFKRYIKNKAHVSILEPSCGDGRFVQSLSTFLCYHSAIKKPLNLSLVDTADAELKKATIIANKSGVYSSIASKCQDYLLFLKCQNEKYSLIIGNPPYIRKENMEKDSIALCEEIRELTDGFANFKRSKSTIKNIWPAFVEGAIMSLKDDGVMCFVLPAEILQVNYTQELRDLILKEFGRIEIFAFNELIFEGIQQDVVALIGIKGLPKKEQGVSFFQVESLEDLKEPRFTEKHSNIHRKTLDKWTNYILSDEELNLLDTLKGQYKPIKDYCNRVEVGIVTAASDYFILSAKEIESNQLNEVVGLIKPILPKGSTVPNVLSFGQVDFQSLRDKNAMVNLVAFPDLDKKELSKIEQKYIALGEISVDDGGPAYHQRYKMIRRNNWYHVPSLWKSDGLFVKRSYHYPKVFVNKADVLATDSFYRISMKEPFLMKNLAFSFYNSLTFVLAELEGRFYGGGVLELTPNEFKNLSLPYVNEIGDEQFDYLDTMIRNNSPVEEILEFTDGIVLEAMPVEVLNELKTMRIKLVNRRKKRNIEIEKTESNLAAEAEVPYGKR